jgi:hypothetical protein
MRAKRAKALRKIAVAYAQADKKLDAQTLYRAMKAHYAAPMGRKAGMNIACQTKGEVKNG